MHTEEPKSRIHLAAANPAARVLRASDRLQLFAHGEALQSLTTHGGLVECLESLRTWLDVSEVVVAAGTVDALPEMRVASSGDDPQWRDLYLREGFVLVDPIVHGIVNGQRFVDRTRVMAENDAAARRLARGPALDRLQEAARDYNRARYGFASGTVFGGCIVLCSVMLAADGRSRERAPLILRALRPVLYEALVRIMLPAQAFPGLSERELAVLECLASGHNDARIADVMAISESTVRFHLRNVFEKLGAHNRCHAVSIGFQSGLLQR